MEDFIFGTLSTNESRISHLADTRGGITHAHQRSPRDPSPEHAVQVELTIGPSYPFDRAWVYWTNDGSDPEGQNGEAINGYATPLEPVNSEWDTFLWGYIRRFRGEIPGQSAGTVVRYRMAAGGGEARRDLRSVFGHPGDAPRAAPHLLHHGEGRPPSPLRGEDPPQVPHAAHHDHRDGILRRPDGGAPSDLDPR